MSRTVIVNYCIFTLIILSFILFNHIESFVGFTVCLILFVVYIAANFGLSFNLGDREGFLIFLDIRKSIKIHHGNTDYLIYFRVGSDGNHFLYEDKFFYGKKICKIEHHIASDINRLKPYLITLIERHIYQKEIVENEKNTRKKELKNIEKCSGYIKKDDERSNNINKVLK